MCRSLLAAAQFVSLFLASAAFARATDVLVVVTIDDKGVEKTNVQRGVVKLEERKVSSYDGELGPLLAQSSRYAIKGGYITDGTHALGRATHLLAQVEIREKRSVKILRGQSSVRQQKRRTTMSQQTGCLQQGKSARCLVE